MDSCIIAHILSKNNDILSAMKCKKCRREIEDNSIFCNWCGHRQLTASNEVRVPKPQHKGNTWYAQVTVEGERVYISGESEEEYYAKASAAKSGLIEAKKPDNRIVKDLVSDYIKAREGTASVSTIDGYERKSKNNLQSLMPLRVKDLTESAVQKAINLDKKKYAGKTIWDAWSLIQSATGVHYDNLLFPSTKPKKKPPVYGEDDVKKIILGLAEYGGQVECAGLLAIWLSLRRSEIMGLKWSDIRKNGIVVRHARVYDKSHKLQEKDNKNETSERTILCDGYILDKLNALPKTGEYVFTISTSGIWEGITKVCKSVGVEHGYLHGFRHTNATIMEYVGVPPKYANQRGGWADDHTRQKTYTDLMTKGGEEASQLVDNFFLNMVSGVKTPDTSDQ